jgi:hypothetical protein
VSVVVGGSGDRCEHRGFVGVVAYLQQVGRLGVLAIAITARWDASSRRASARRALGTSKPGCAHRRRAPSRFASPGLDKLDVANRGLAAAVGIGGDRDVGWGRLRCGASSARPKLDATAGFPAGRGETGHHHDLGACADPFPHDRR